VCVTGVSSSVYYGGPQPSVYYRDLVQCAVQTGAHQTVCVRVSGARLGPQALTSEAQQGGPFAGAANTMEGLLSLYRAVCRRLPHHPAPTLSLRGPGHTGHVKTIGPLLASQISHFVVRICPPTGEIQRRLCVRLAPSISLSYSV